MNNFILLIFSNILLAWGEQKINGFSCNSGRTVSEQHTSWQKSSLFLPCLKANIIFMIWNSFDILSKEIFFTYSSSYVDAKGVPFPRHHQAMKKPMKDPPNAWLRHQKTLIHRANQTTVLTKSIMHRTILFWTLSCHSVSQHCSDISVVFRFFLSIILLD